MNIAPADAIDAARPLMAAMSRLGIPHYIGGSLASSIHGNPRSTIDADLVAEVRLDQVGDLFAEIESEFFGDIESIRRAVKQRDSFNVLSKEKLVKIDVFVLKQYRYEQQVIGRVVRLPPDPESPEDLLPFCSAEDIILNKLTWYEAGGRASERQWLDLLAVIRVQHASLDYDYLRQWASYLDVEGLLAEALNKAAELDGR